MISSRALSAPAERGDELGGGQRVIRQRACRRDREVHVPETPVRSDTHLDAHDAGVVGQQDSHSACRARRRLGHGDREPVDHLRVAYGDEPAALSLRPCGSNAQLLRLGTSEQLIQAAGKPLDRSGLDVRGTERQGCAVGVEVLDCCRFRAANLR